MPPREPPEEQTACDDLVALSRPFRLVTSVGMGSQDTATFPMSHPKDNSHMVGLDDSTHPTPTPFSLVLTCALSCFLENRTALVAVGTLSSSVGAFAHDCQALPHRLLLRR